jgi:HAMP domain-containing protein
MDRQTDRKRDNWFEKLITERAIYLIVALLLAVAASVWSNVELSASIEARSIEIAALTKAVEQTNTRLDRQDQQMTALSDLMREWHEEVGKMNVIVEDNKDEINRLRGK